MYLERYSKMMHNDFTAEDFYAALKRTIELLDERKPTLIITKSDEQRLTPEELKKIQEMAHLRCVPDEFLDENKALLIPTSALNYMPKGVTKYEII